MSNEEAAQRIQARDESSLSLLKDFLFTGGDHGNITV